MVLTKIFFTFHWDSASKLNVATKFAAISHRKKEVMWQLNMTRRIMPKLEGLYIILIRRETEPSNVVLHTYHHL